MGIIAAMSQPRSLLVAVAFACACPPTPELPPVASDPDPSETSGGSSSTSSSSSGDPTDPTGGTDTGAPVPCVVDPPPDATRVPGLQEDGALIGFTGRIATPAGPSTLVDGFPVDLALHPNHDVAYVTIAGRSLRALKVLDRTTHAELQSITREGAFRGLAIAPDGTRVYAARGEPGGLDVYAVEGDGTLTPAGAVAASDWTSGIAQSADGSRLWLGSFDTKSVREVDTATLTVVRTLSTGVESYDVVWVPGRDELYVSEFSGDRVVVLDLVAGEVAATISLPTSPAGMAVSPDGARVYVAVSGADTVAAIATATREVELSVPVAEPEFTDDMGAPLPNSNVGALHLDADAGRLYAVRGADNAISVFTADTLELLGSIPTALYPTDLELAPGGDQLVVSEGRGAGLVGPGGDAKNNRRGSVSFVDLAGLDLVASTDEAVANYRRPLDMLPFTCGGDHPLAPEGASPIEHVILVVKENKTFDCLFGALEIDASRDPSMQVFPSSTTPNQRALAQQFNISDNFFSDAAESDTGHTALVNAHLTEWVERIWQDRDAYDVWGFYPVNEVSRPDRGSFFTWVVDHDLSLRIYGEIVGAAAISTKGAISQYSDPDYPGGVIVNYEVKDEDKAKYVAARIAEGELAAFTYVSLPNDHGVGVSPGKPTPESMVADNDYGVGIIVDALSHSPFWDKSALIVLQDDPQGCSDHVEAHRGFVTIVSPWARRGYVSHVHYSFAHVFATIRRLLGLPPLGRPDAAAAPMYDLFTNVPDLTPFTALPREYPEELADAAMPGVSATRCMDFRSADRNPDLELVYDEYFAWRRGQVSRARADANIAARRAAGEGEGDDDDDDELLAFDAAWAAHVAALQARGEVPPALPDLGPAPGCAAPDDD